MVAAAQRRDDMSKFAENSSRLLFLPAEQIKEFSIRVTSDFSLRTRNYLKITIVGVNIVFTWTRLRLL